MSEPNTQKITAGVVDALEDLKATDVQVLDVSAMTAITDVMIVASGTSSRHVKSLADRVLGTAKDHSFAIQGIEGEEGGEWVLVDLGAVIVHVMQAQARMFYNIEGLWSPRKAKLASVGSTASVSE